MCHYILYSNRVGCDKVNGTVNKVTLCFVLYCESLDKNTALCILGIKSFFYFS